MHRQLCLLQSTSLRTVTLNSVTCPEPCHAPLKVWWAAIPVCAAASITTALLKAVEPTTDWTDEERTLQTAIAPNLCSNPAHAQGMKLWLDCATHGTFIRHATISHTRTRASTDNTLDLHVDPHAGGVGTNCELRHWMDRAWVTFYRGW
jgi:hypothetical protein